jgi:hypothetical protein
MEQTIVQPQAGNMTLSAMIKNPKHAALAGWLKSKRFSGAPKKE